MNPSLETKTDWTRRKEREREKVGMTEAEEPYVMVHALHMTGERRETHKFC
jgi:hypothetical protein